MKNKKSKNEVSKKGKPLPAWFMAIIPVYICAVLAPFIFLPAGDWAWFEGWTFMVTLVVNLTISFIYINKKNPRVLRNRMKIKKEGLTAATEKSAGSDRFIMPVMSIGFFSALILPGLDHRFGWTSIPLAVEMIGLVVMNVGALVMNIAILQNPFASKLLDINEGQMLVDTGLYAVVRHPLYAGAVFMILGTPVALGSWWALIPAVLAALSLVARIHFEEEMLLKGMDGYSDYQSRVKYKLIPGIY